MSANVSRGLNISHNLCRGASRGDRAAAVVSRQGLGGNMMSLSFGIGGAKRVSSGSPSCSRNIR